MKTSLLALTLAALAMPAQGGQIETRAALDAVLSGSEEYLEDFEHVSFHAGSVMPLANPFNHMTGGALWADLIPGASYASNGDLSMYAGFLFGDDSNILRGTDGITITFDEPQLAIGFDLVGSAGTPHKTLTFFKGTVVLDTWEFDTSSVIFAGWQHSSGITSVRIETSAGGGTSIDNVAWGVAVEGCLGDADSSGAIDFGDLLEVLANWGGCDCPADVNVDGQVNFADLLIVLSGWGPCV